MNSDYFKDVLLVRGAYDSVKEIADASFESGLRIVEHIADVADHGLGDDQRVSVFDEAIQIFETIVAGEGKTMYLLTFSVLVSDPEYAYLHRVAVASVADVVVQAQSRVNAVIAHWNERAGRGL